MKNLQLPGNPRYQPKGLVKVFGYDNLYRNAIRVEFTALRTLCENKSISIPNCICQLFTKELEEIVIEEITTTMVDELERKVTKHDIRALVELIKKNIPEALWPYVHIPLTSYDVLDTARALSFKEAFEDSLKPSLIELQKNLASLVLENKNIAQIGRTHGQHALPITVGFWLATTLDRIYNNYIQLSAAADNLRGKISGAVGAYNAQHGLGIDGFENSVLDKLNLKSADISTQIAQPEPLANFLFACILISASLAQFGRDCRNLMRSEIGELAEAFESGQVGSSTMAHKRNPINFENLEGMYIRNQSEFFKVLSTLISEHQRDLVGSSVMRDMPIIVINLQQQIDTLNKKANDKTFLERIVFDKGRIRQNLEKSADYILAEPIYLMMQLYGYEGNAHELVNSHLLAIAKAKNTSLYEELTKMSINDSHIESVMERIPAELKEMMKNPAAYTGLAEKKAEQIYDKVINGLKA